ncbi:hypothetical protein GOBAR_AA19836 [Gossypium barbadense]|uniref:Uncharacterized protein n=1 Tax=Gossypium barbadense TaxID=3634 RepID=A0A2P5XBV9_GOSBA|nr:hypothetical protein GOBAR_AA19836 [Gossypium barbadense]
MVRNPKDHNSGDALDPGRNLRGILNFSSLNFQSIAKESGHNLSFNEDVNLRNMSIMVQDDAFNSSGPMELTLAEENDPLTTMEGKKRQRLGRAAGRNEGPKLECSWFGETSNGNELVRLKSYSSFHIVVKVQVRSVERFGVLSGFIEILRKGTEVVHVEAWVIFIDEH